MLGSAQWEVSLTARPGALLSGAGNRKLRLGLKAICEEVAGSDEGTIGDVGPGHHTRQQKGACWLQANPCASPGTRLLCTWPDTPTPDLSSGLQGQDQVHTQQRTSGVEGWALAWVSLGET